MSQNVDKRLEFFLENFQNLIFFWQNLIFFQIVILEQGHTNHHPWAQCCLLPAPVGEILL